MVTNHCKVAIIGSGPGGLAAATELGKLGIDNVVVLEREIEAGGIPRHCGHSVFGLREFHLPLSGTRYVQKLTKAAQQQGVEIRLRTTVTEIGPGGRLTLSTPTGIETLIADKVLLSTGNRESPRSTRLVSGSRPPGIVTTGALQSMVYLKRGIPFHRPVIVGSELVSFSALLTCRHAGIKPVAMIDESERVIAWQFSALLPRLLGVPLNMNTTIDKIYGADRVEAIEFTDTIGVQHTIECDGIVFSGNFVAETSLVRMSHLDFDFRSATPCVDQFGRCSDLDYFACGNLLHPVDTAGWCWAEGRRTARQIKRAIDGELPPSKNCIKIDCPDEAIKYFTPQRVVLSNKNPCNDHPGLQIRFNVAGHGNLTLSNDSKTLSRQRLHALPERRILLPLPQQPLTAGDSLVLGFQK